MEIFYHCENSLFFEMLFLSASYVPKKRHQEIAQNMSKNLLDSYKILPDACHVRLQEKKQAKMYFFHGKGSLYFEKIWFCLFLRSQKIDLKTCTKNVCITSGPL